MREPRFRFLVASISLVVAGCSAPLPSTDLPPARFVSAAPEFPGLRDYRGIVDLRIKASGLDQTAVADLAKSAQIDFIVLGDQVKPGDSDFGIGGFTSDILFIPGGAVAVGRGGLLAVNPPPAISPTLTPADLLAPLHH